MSKATILLNEVTWTNERPVDIDYVRRNLREDGYVLVRNLIPKDDIRRLRDIVGAHLRYGGVRYQLGNTQPNAAASVPELGFIFSHPRIAGMFRKIFGDSSAVFTRHCDIHRNMVSGWHKDSGESVKGGYFKGDYFAADDCEVFKIALYLQDSTPTSALKIEPGSHRSSRVTGGEKVQLPTRAGDAVIFDVRLSHAGQLPDPVERVLQAAVALINGGHRKSEDPSIITRLHDVYWRLIGRADRMSVFFTFGRCNEFTFDFASANLGRQASQISGEIGDDNTKLINLAQTLYRQGVFTYGVNVGDVASEPKR